MADVGLSGDFAKAIGDPLATVGALLAGFVPEGPIGVLAQGAAVA
jgi:hypothetical protein